MLAILNHTGLARGTQGNIELEFVATNHQKELRTEARTENYADVSQTKHQQNENLVWQANKHWHLQCKAQEDLQTEAMQRVLLHRLVLQPFTEKMLGTVPRSRIGKNAEMQCGCATLSHTPPIGVDTLNSLKVAGPLWLGSGKVPPSHCKK